MASSAASTVSYLPARDPHYGSDRGLYPVKVKTVKTAKDVHFAGVDLPSLPPLPRVEKKFIDNMEYQVTRPAASKRWAPVHHDALGL